MKKPDHEQFKALAEQYSLIRLRSANYYNRRKAGKAPIEKDWQKHSFEKQSFDEIGFMMDENAGIVCGPASGLLVLDIDDEELFRTTAAKLGWTIPETCTVRTGSGGLHYYFRYPEDGKQYGNRGRAKSQGFDIRGTGGCVVAPGSVHPETGKLYRFENDIPIAEAPQWLKDLALSEGKPATKQQGRNPAPVEAPSIELEPVDVDALRVSSRIRDLIATSTPQGQRSEAIMAVLDALVREELSDGQIYWIFENRPIGEKYLEKRDARQRWLYPQLAKARHQASAIGGPRRPKTEPPVDIFKLMEENPELNEQAYELLGQVLDQSINGIKHGELTAKAFDILIKNLKGFGSLPSEDHQAALLEVLKAYTDMAQGVLQGRHAFPLATGMGKTQSTVAWVAALYQLGITHISLAICASKVEALCDLKRDLIREGVSSDVIGLLHSYNFDEEYARKYLGDGEALPQGFASLPSTENHEDKQILLVTHNRVRGRGRLEVYHLFKGKPRDLLIWDESLFISDTRAVSEVEIRSAVGWWKPRIGQDAKTQEVMAYLVECINVLETELEAQKQDGRQPEMIHLPELTPNKLREYKRVIGTTPTLAVLLAFLDISQSDLRVVSTPQRGGFISFDIAVPLELKNIIILDASHNIRELVLYDETIKNASKWADEVVSYEQVTVHQLYLPSGRTAMKSCFGKSKREERWVCLEIVGVVKSIPESEGIIVFTFKARDRVNFKEILMADLEASGIDVQARIQVRGQEKSRFVWLTWGQETSLSQFNYCSNVIFAGVLHRSHVDLASAIVGQQADLQASVSHAEIQRVERSEIAHCLYQAMSRGSCRVIANLMASPMNVWLIHKDTKIEMWIKEVMPGVRWETWEPVHAVSQGEEGSLRYSILEFLNDLPEDMDKVSTIKVKQSLNIQPSQARTFTRAVQNLEDCSEWKLEARSLVRVRPFEEYDF